MENKIFEQYTAARTHMLCIDSDGCAFDTMEIKHKECFCPALIHAWDLQPISKYVREAWEYANLYSRDRGRSRFHEILIVFDLLARREEVRQCGFILPDIEPLRRWVKTAPLLNNEELAEFSADPVMKRALEWSYEMNRRAAEMVYGIPPFPGVRESLAFLRDKADIVIVSATPREALEREWAEHGLMQYVRLLCAQEDASKAECIALLKKHYRDENVLMVGDAPGDWEAAKKNGVHFYPILPAGEIESWRVFRDEAARRFLAGSYGGAYEEEQIRRFSDCLPDSPPWERKKQ